MHFIPVFIFNLFSIDSFPTHMHKQKQKQKS